MKHNPYAAHWVGSVIRKAYSIMKGLRKRYLGVRKVKPKIRRFARCKTALMKIIYEAKAIGITLRLGEYLYVSWRSTWLEKRVRVWDVVLERLYSGIACNNTIKSPEEIEVTMVISWDSNEPSLDGYEPSIGFIHTDLRPL